MLGHGHILIFYCRVKEVLFLLVAAVGCGCLFQTPLIGTRKLNYSTPLANLPYLPGLQAAMPAKDMATATATLGLLRTIGGTVGISAGGAIYISFLRRRLDKISGYDAASIPNGALINNVGSLTQIQPQNVQDEVIAAYAKSISSIWLVCTPMVFVGLIAGMSHRLCALLQLDC